MTQRPEQARYYAKVKDTPEFKARRAVIWKKWADKNREKLRERDRIRGLTRDHKAAYRNNLERRKASAKKYNLSHRASRAVYEMRRYRKRKEDANAPR